MELDVLGVGEISMPFGKKHIERLDGRVSARSTAGETIVETLVAIVICAFAVVVLTTSTVVAARLNAAAQTRDASFDKQRTAAETGAAASAADGTVTIAGKDYSVLFYGGDAVSSYELDSGA